MLTQQEKALLNEACNVYLQIVSQQIPPEQVNQIATAIGNLLHKIDTGSIDQNQTKPNGITDEWFDNVCKSCKHLSGITCNEKVTEKFPGKCDPILTFEQQKIINKKKAESENITTNKVIENEKPKNVIGDSSVFVNKI